MSLSANTNCPTVVFTLLERLYDYIRHMCVISDQHLIEGIVHELQKVTPISSLFLAQFKNDKSLNPVQFRCCASVNISEDYKEHYISNKLYKIDSILKYSNSTSIPITWNAALNSKYKNMEFESFLDVFNFKHGLSYCFENSFQNSISYLAFESLTYDCIVIQCVAIS